MIKFLDSNFRGNFCVALLILLLGAPMAHAGQWVREYYVVTGATVSQDVACYSMASSGTGPSRYYGGVSRQGFRAKKQGMDHITAQHLDTASIEANWGAVDSSSPNYTPIDGAVPKVEARVGVTAYAVLKWHRNQIMKSDDSGMMDDPDDDPPPFLYFLETTSVGGRKFSYSQANWQGDYFSLQASNSLGDTLGEKVLASQSAFSTVWRYDSPIRTRFGKRAVTGDTVKGPQASFRGTITMKPGYENHSKVAATISFWYDLEPLNFTFTPDPNGLAVMACPPNGKTLNQYVMNGSGGAPFTIDCRAGVSLAASSFDSVLRDGFSWEIERAPLPMLATAPNGFSRSYYGDYVEIKRRSYPPSPILGVTPTPGPTPLPTATPLPDSTPVPTATPIDGMGFDTRGGLPSSNGAFGPNTIFHLFSDPTVQGPPQRLAQSPIALFYDATATTHTTTPSGAAGYDYTDGTTSIPTPNWFYYYSQSYMPPCPLQYSNHPTHYGYYTPGDSFIRLCNAYKPWTTFLFRVTGGPLSSGGSLELVGSETVRGIDTYVRILKHEYAHKRCYEAIHNPIPSQRLADTDVDGVPDRWEGDVGLIVWQNFDSTGFAAHFNDPSTYPPSSGDSESFARLYEEGEFGPLGEDWATDTAYPANSGLNWGTSIAPNRCHRTSVLRNLSGNVVSALPGDKVVTKPKP